MYKTIDLFAGAGGLSLGFEQTGMFRIVLAAENNTYAAATYKRNHPQPEIKSDVRTINYSDVRRKYGSIDLVIGGPPCQGFSNANRQKATISANNELVKEFVRAIRELKPSLFVMENVSMLKSETHRFYCTSGDIAELERFQIPYEDDRITLSSLFPELSRSLATLRTSLNNYRDYLWDDSFYHTVNILYKRIANDSKFKSSWEKYAYRLKKYVSGKERSFPNNRIGNSYQSLFDGIASTAVGSGDLSSLKEAVRIANQFQTIFRRYDEIVSNHIKIDGIEWKKEIAVKVRSYSVLDYIRCSLEHEKTPYRMCFKVLNAADYGAPQRRERFVIIGSRIGEKPKMPTPIFHECNYRTVRDAIEDLQVLKPNTSPKSGSLPVPKCDIAGRPLLQLLRNSDRIENHVITATSEVAQKRFDALEEGGNFHTLPDHLKSTYSDGKRTQSTIYLKLKYDEPSGTVVNVRKSMWVHPVLSRALSIREAARLQTFPDKYVFEGSKDSQYQQVGNAVPPILANAIAKEIVAYLESHNRGRIRDRLLTEMQIAPELSQKELALRLGVSQGTVSRYFRILVNEGKLERIVTEGKQCRWVVK